MKVSTVVKNSSCKLKFPLLARFVQRGQESYCGSIVLFKDVKSGCVLFAPAGTIGGKSVGESFGDFAHVSDPNIWEILPEGSTVTLIQDKVLF